MKAFKKLVSAILVISCLATLFVVSASAAATMAMGASTVTATSLNIRSGPGTSYSSLGTVRADEIVVIYEQTDSTWHKINYKGTSGYVDCSYLTTMLTAENFDATGKVDGSGVRMRTSPNTDADILGTYSNGTVMDIIGINSGWFKVVHSGKTGYIRSDYMEIVSTTSASFEDYSEGSAVSGVRASNTGSELGQQIANFALQYVGYRYVYGAESPSRGFDCSGLVYYTYGQFGYSVSRTASQQYKNNGYIVSKSDLQPGDLVFFSSNGYSVTHVGIYIGDNQFVHASTSKTGVIISNLGSSYYTRVWFAGKRIV